MFNQPIPRSRIILAAMVPFVLLGLIGMGLTLVQVYKLAFWARAEATYLGSASVRIDRGSSSDHSYSELHYQFVKRNGREVQLYFLEKSGAPMVKAMPVLYDPSVDAQITRDEGSRWERASIFYVLLFVGLGMTIAGFLPSLIGVGLLVWDRFRPTSPVSSPHATPPDKIR
jgi:hypothetical protein